MTKVILSAFALGTIAGLASDGMGFHPVLSLLIGVGVGTIVVILGLAATA